MNIWKSLLLAGTFLATCSGAWAAQAPGALSSPDVPISHHDRVYAAEQFSNTVSVTDPVDNKLLGVIKLGMRSRPISAHSTRVRFSSMAWVIRLIIARLLWRRYCWQTSDLQRTPRHFTRDHGRFAMVAITSQPSMS
jgi:hypothetical protein